MDKKLIMIAAAFSVAAPSRVWSQACGGTERWPIKVGADAGAAQVNLTPQPTTVHDLVLIQRPSPSRFATQLQSVRAKFLAQFPNFSATDWTDAGGIPVRVTGVVFFDRPH